VTPENFEDISYRTIDGVDLMGRLYRPASDRPSPYVIDVHGGAWGSGDRMNNTIIHRDFVGHGIGVFALDFRLAPGAKFPAPVDDVNYAVRWFKANTGRLGAKASVIGGLGSSSGAQQMGLVALRPNDPLYTSADPALAGVDASVAFFIACWPILDPLARYRMAQAAGKERLVNAHIAYFGDEAAMTRGNPFLVVERGEATHKPPVIIIQGTEDDNVEHKRADLFAEAYRKAGGKVELHKYDGMPHTFVTARPDEAASKQAIAALRAFVLAQAG
jgi:acetyl esterase/lipase